MSQDLQTTQRNELREDTAQQEAYVVPPVDVFEDENCITLLADLPGVSRERVNVRVVSDSLLIEATADTGGPQNIELLYGEAQCPAYGRQFSLSRELDAEHMQARLRDGVLQLTIPKAEEAKPRRIQVNVG